ncbi:MAG TPA: antibiotic biosynthesis monooxygenase [Dehalococcoidia bacterium]|nr:antibiotic biosynthesis monooxygenase [Dehalococcoidia bacterium]
MDIIMVEVNVKPERLDAFMDLIRYDAEHSENDEPGCLRFDVLRDTEDPLKFFYYEVYKDEAARMAHRETPHYKRYSTESADMFSGPLTRHIVNNFAPSNENWR